MARSDRFDSLLVVRHYKNRHHCKQCDRHRDECGRISRWGGLCEACGLSNMRQNVHGMATHSGPAFTAWRHSVAASVGAQLVDDSSDDA